MLHWFQGVALILWNEVGYIMNNFKMYLIKFNFKKIIKMLGSGKKKILISWIDNVIFNLAQSLYEFFTI